MTNQGISSEEISLVTGARVVQEGYNRIYSLAIDSRGHYSGPHTLFIALKGERRDGHAFLSDAWKNGIRNFLVSEPIDASQLPDSLVLEVPDTLRAMQQIAGYHRSQFYLPVIGITGSNGKTVVKEWLNALLSDEYVIARSPRSYNSQIGVALSVWNIESMHTLGIFEAGISRPGEMSNLTPMIRPDIGVLTTIGTAHLEFFGDHQLISDEKCLLFSGCRAIVYPADNQFARITLSKSPYVEKDQVGWGFSEIARLRILSKTIHDRSTELAMQWDSRQFSLTIPFTDAASVENGLTCLATLLVLGYTVEEISPRISRLEPLAMRMEILSGVNDSVIINDSWSCDLDSLAIALDVAGTNSRQRPVTLILSDILQSGLGDEELYTRVNDLLVTHGVTRLTGIGPNIRSAASCFTVPPRFFESTEVFLAALDPFEFSHDAILVKGAREFRFERIIKLLEEKTHDTVLEINLGALSHNLNYFRSGLHPSTQVMVMVKAFGYGSGAREVSALLEFNKVDYLAVAYADEGVALRNAGISLPVMVMHPERSSLPVLLRHHLEPELYHFNILRQFASALDQAGVREPYPVHIEIDTGMKRLGFQPDETDELIAEIKANPQLQIASVFTHLAASEDPNHDAFTHEQASIFSQVCDRIAADTGIEFRRHILNTGGIQRFPEYQFDMVRLGIGLYGVSSKESDQNKLLPVGRLRTVISQIKKLTRGESVGYGRRFIAPGDMTMAVIPMGYADGLRRTLSNGNGKVWIHGKLAPIIGNVCMDMTMVDISDIECREGDEVELFGPHIPVNTFAEWSQTIPYEILTSVSQRVRRIYMRE
jgi:Alr-MurF fusion protein